MTALKDRLNHAIVTAFVDLMANAHEDALDLLEEEARRRGTETTVEVGGAHSNVPEVQQANSRLAETFKTPHKWLYTMADKNTLKLTGADGTLLPLVRVPSN